MVEHIVILETLDILQLYMIRYCTQHNNYFDKTSVSAYSRKTPHTLALQVSYGVSFMSYTKKNGHDISRAHCTLNSHGMPTWASCQIRKIAGAHAPGMPGTFSPSPQVSDPHIHYGTCVSWCMPGSPTIGFLWNRRRGETFPASPAHAQPAILRIW